MPQKLKDPESYLNPLEDDIKRAEADVTQKQNVMQTAQTRLRTAQANPENYLEPISRAGERPAARRAPRVPPSRTFGGGTVTSGMEGQQPDLMGQGAAQARDTRGQEAIEMALQSTDLGRVLPP